MPYHADDDEMDERQAAEQKQAKAERLQLKKDREAQRVQLRKEQDERRKSAPL